MNNDKITKTSIYLTDIFIMLPFFLVAIFGILSIAVVSIFITIASIIHIIQSLSLPEFSQIILRIFFCDLMLVCCILFGYIDYIVIRSVANGSKKYLNERKIALDQINSK